MERVTARSTERINVHRTRLRRERERGAKGGARLRTYVILGPVCIEVSVTLPLCCVSFAATFVGRRGRRMMIPKKGSPPL